VDGFETRDIAKVLDSAISREQDYVTSEEALAISVVTNEHGIQKLGVTMRTIGDDRNLVIGFLFSEGIINSIDDIETIEDNSEQITVSLGDDSGFDPDLHCRSGTVTSACGICGRSTIDDRVHIHAPELDEKTSVGIDAIRVCLKEMKSRQILFSQTGGSHACASFNMNCEISRIFEDVGRHNAMDKLVGSYVSDEVFPKSELLFVSGRASFELVQKCLRIGFPIMIAIGGPTTLAVDLAKEHGLTLGCFARSDSLTVYSGVRRIAQ
jgi:FdhD protein